MDRTQPEPTTEREPIAWSDEESSINDEAGISDEDELAVRARSYASYANLTVCLG